MILTCVSPSLQGFSLKLALEIDNICLMIRPTIVYPQLKDFDFRIDEKDLLRLQKLSPWKSFFSIFWNWCLIGAFVWISVGVSSPILTFFCLFGIATRQHALLIIMHDAAHGLILQNRKWNDRWIHWLVTYPFLFSIYGFRYEHQLHHKYMNSPRDPNWSWKQETAEWEFPQKKRSVLKLSLRALFSPEPVLARARLVYRTIRQFPAHLKADPVNALIALTYHTVLWGLILYLGLFKEVLFFWFLPMFTFLQFIMKVRVMAEHFGVSYEDDLNHARNYVGPWIERWLFTPQNVAFHLDHHLYPKVPLYNLPELHRLLKKDQSYMKSAHINDSLLMILGKKSVWRDLVGNRGQTKGG